MEEYNFSILQDAGFWMRFVHLAGAILSVGAVTVTDSLLSVVHFRPGLAPLISRLAHVLSLVVWVGLLMLGVTGIYLTIANPDLIQDTVFQVKMGLVALVFINGVWMNIWVSPRFEDLSDEWHQDTRRVNRFQKFAGVAAVISLIGWWSIILVTLFNRFN